MQFMRLLMLLFVVLLAVDAMDGRPSKKAMRNSLVRFGKRGGALPSDIEFAPVDDRWAAYLDREPLYYNGN